MTEADVEAITRWVLASAFAIGIAFGFVAQRTRFCTMGAMADLAVTGDATRLRLWAVAAATAIVGFNLMVGLGWVRAADSIYAGPRIAWLSALSGGLMFGVGMVLASGCTAKNLMRAGSGNLKAVVVLLMVALAGFATLKGITAVLRVATVDTVFAGVEPAQDLPSLLGAAIGMPTAGVAAALGIVLGGALFAAALWRGAARSAEFVAGGIGLGLLVVAAWWVSGVLGHVDEHPVTLESVFLATSSHRMEALSFVASTSYGVDYLLFFSDASKALTIGIVSAVGLVVGAFVHAVASGTFRWEGFGGVADLRNHLAGGALMGVGGITALGCTIGQGLSGISTLGLTSFVALASIMAAGYATVRFQVWRVERDDAAGNEPAPSPSSSGSTTPTPAPGLDMAARS